MASKHTLENSESTEAGGHSRPSNSSGRRGGRIPGIPFWCVVGLSVLGAAIVANLFDDPAVFRIVAAIGSGVTLFTFLGWLFFSSSYPLSIRRGIPLALLALAILAVSLFRVESWSGALIPTLVYRWSPRYDASVGELQATRLPDANGIDLLTSTSDDFPQFLGPERNSVFNGVGLSRDWTSTPPQELWRRRIGAGWSGFATRNGYAVTLEQRGDQEIVACYSIESGEPQWSHSVQTRHESTLGYVGPRSTPTIYNGRVYALGGTGILCCLDGRNGQEVWRRDLMADRGLSQAEAEQAVPWGRANSPLVVDDQLIVPIGGSAPGNSIGLAAFSLESGEPLWEQGPHQISYVSPAVGTLCGKRQLIMVNESNVTGHDIRTGAELWEFPWEGLSNMNANCSQPHVVGDSQVFLSKGYGKGAALIQVTQDEGNWQAKEVWAERVLKTKFSNVAIRDGYAYALDDGVLSCAEVATGKRQWKNGRYRYGQILMVDDLLLVMSEFGKLALVEANPNKHVELGSFQVLDGQTWNTLCLSGHKLLVRNAEEAACYLLP